jgi:hypothetical protein
MPVQFWHELPAIIAALFAGVGVIISSHNAKKVNEVHSLVNSDHGVALRLAATTLQRVADMTKSPADERDALAAKTAADNHDATQARINDGKA